MTTTVSKGEYRKYNYHERALRARMYARFLMPVALFLAGTSVWKDPVMAAQLTEGLTEIRPVAETYLTGTPLENMLSFFPDVPDVSGTDADPAESAGLPQIDPAASADENSSRS